MTALEELTALVANLPNASLLTPSMKQSALDNSLMPDQLGVWPGAEGYIKTYDVYFAALGLLGFLRAQPVVRQTSSEGTSMAVDAPDWAGLATWYRSLSPVAQASGRDVLGVIAIPDGGPHVRRTDMTERSSGYNDVDTDVS